MPADYTRRSFHRLIAGAVLVRPIVAAPGEVITAPLADWTKYPELKKYAPAFLFLQKNDFSSREPGRTDIDGNRMYATLTANKAKSPEGGKFETHRKYLDIHYLVAGREWIGSMPARELKVTDPYEESKDIELFQLPSKYRKIDMQPGHFAVFLPGQCHLPGCGPDTSSVIRKVVVKVQV